MNSNEQKAHWEGVWTEREADSTSWFQALPAPSLDLIAGSGLAPDDAIIDVGGGASLLVDCLLDAGYRDVTVLDIAASALGRARARLGDRAEKVAWLVCDVTAFRPEKEYALWHDRAVFHFLVEREQRQRYVHSLEKAVPAGGQAIIATFAPDGPLRCSNLDTTRYDAAGMQEELGAGWRLRSERREIHRTPGGSEQAFAWFHFQRAE
jgi:trans-aconitate methyltransferase